MTKITRKTMRNNKTRINRQKGGDINHMEQFILKLSIRNIEENLQTPKYKVTYVCAVTKMFSPMSYGRYPIDIIINFESEPIKEKFIKALKQIMKKYKVTQEEVETLHAHIYGPGSPYVDFSFPVNVARQVYYEFIQEPGSFVSKKRTRSNQSNLHHSLGPSKRITNRLSLQTKTGPQLTITLSDGQAYTYDEIKEMWNKYSKTHTISRHPYTPEDIEKITDILNYMEADMEAGGKTKKIFNLGRVR